MLNFSKKIDEIKPNNKEKRTEPWGTPAGMSLDDDKNISLLRKEALKFGSTRH